METPPHPPPGDAGDSVFARDRLTLLAYALAVVFGFTIGAFGPAMPLLRDDLGISRTVGGLHFTVVAAGAVVFGGFVDRLARSWGRRALFWLGGSGVAAGALLFGAGGHPAVTLAGAALIGGPGTGLLAAVQATLADRHGRHRAVALTEANTAASAGTVAPALLIGVLAGGGAGWRTVFVVPALGLAAAFVAGRTEEFPPPSRAPSGRSGRLPRRYWVFWAALVPAVGAEWSVGAWGAGYLVDVAGTSEAAASLLMTSFFGAMLIGRLLGGRVARRHDPFRLLLGAAAVGLCGIMTLWASTAPVPATAGLFVCGLGISMLFPMLLTLAIGSAPDRSDTATARISMAAGSSVLVAPITLGAIADRVGIRAAFGLVPCLFAAVAALAAAARLIGSPSGDA